MSGPAPSFDIPSDGPVELPLSRDDLHHAFNVLRLRPGQSITLVGSDARAWEFVIGTIARDAAHGTPVRVSTPRPGPRVTLIQGLAKGDKMDLVIEKAVELGVDAIHPVVFERSVVRLDERKAVARGERFRRIAHAAARQSQRDHVPNVTDPIHERDLVALLSAFDVVLVAWEGAEGVPGVRDALRRADVQPDARVALVVGPEGGLTECEVASLADRGASVVTLGETILRTETAGIVGTALVLHELGGLGGGSV